MTDHSNNGTPPDNPPGPPLQQHDWQAAPHQQTHDPHYHSPPEPQHFEPVIAKAVQPQEFLKTRKKTSRTIKLMQLMMSLTFFAAIGIAGFVMFTRLQVDKPGPLTKQVVFEVGKGQGLSMISSRLHKNGIISDRRLFALHAMASKSAKKLKAGKYAIPQAASMQDVLNILVKGKAIFYKVTLPEGWTSEQIVNALRAHP